MTINKVSRKERYNNIVLNYNFPQLGENKGPEMPAPSLEDIRDSKKEEFFTLEQKILKS